MDFYKGGTEAGSYLSAPYSQQVLREICGQIHGFDLEIVCDVGSGSGSNLALLRDAFPQCKLIALDLSLDALVAGRRDVPWALSFVADVHTLPLSDCRVDLVVCTEVLEHVADLHAAAREIARVVRPRGYAVVSSPNYLNLMGLRKWLEDLRHGQGYWDPWGGHAGFERLMLPWHMRRALKPYFEIRMTRGAGYLMAWFPLGYRRIGALHDRWPFRALGRWPIFRDIALNRFLLLRKKDIEPSDCV